MDFEVTRSAIRDGSVLLIAVDGELDIATCKRVRPLLGEAISARRPLVLDLSECPVIDCTGLALVLHTYKGLDRGDARAPALAVVVGDPEIRKLFSLTAIDQSVPVFGARGDAVACLMGERQPTRSPAPPLIYS